MFARKIKAKIKRANTVRPYDVQIEFRFVGGGIYAYRKIVISYKKDNLIINIFILHNSNFYAKIKNRPI